MESDIIEDDIDGSIVSIHVRNFFCHDNLEVKFNRNVNFIVGRNGSGKSAILTALIVGLGGRASATNRGNNLTSFIKKGANSATIEIKIKNSSPKAYRHEVYGDYITIVRNITPTGSSYKIKSATGEIVSMKFEEVNAIILAHDIQVNNPISVLNQDDARSFHAADAKKKYGLFRKATNLDQTEHNYNSTIENCERATIKLKKKNEVFAELEKEFKKWKNIYEQLQSQDKNEELKRSLQNEYYWSEIAGLEREAAKIQAQYDKQRAEMERQNQKLREMDLSHGSNKSNIVELKKRLEENSRLKMALEQKLFTIEQEANNARSSLRTIQNSRVKNVDTLNKERRKIDDLTRAIQNIRSGGAEAQRAELEARATKTTAIAEAARARYSTAQHEAEQARHARAHADGQAGAAARRVQQHREVLGNLKQQLRELESRGNDSLAVYGKNMSELCRKINSMPEGYFSAPPKGPIGAYLKVKEKKWGGALEHIIGGAIQSFCVNTPEDSRKLFQIMGQVYGNATKPSVTCSRFLPRAHDVRRTRVAARQYRSALDSLDVTEPVIANFLIDNIRMESILLVPEHDVAINLSDKEENVPQNCSKIVTLDCTEFHPAPNYRSYGGDSRQSRYLVLSTAERKKQLMAEIQEKESELRSLEAKAAELSCEAQQARQLEATAAKALQALLVQLHDKEEQQRDAAAALEQQQAPQYDALADDLAVSQERVKSLEIQVKEFSSKEDQYQKKSNEIDKDMKDIESQIRTLINKYSQIREEIDQEEMKQDQGLTKRRMLEQSLREKETKMAQVEEILATKRTGIEKKITAALKLCPRVENPRDLETVTNELKKTQLKLSAMRCEGLTKAEVTEKYLQVQRKYRKDKQSLMYLKEIIATLKSTAEDHLKFCQKVQTEIVRRVQHTFQSILLIRGYSGRMDIRNGEGLLEIMCSGRETSGQRHASSTSSLSGGERSYSTVAFIMALWECVELPFYFMDEFDVFMDNINRKTVMDLLIDHALNNTSRQFVFLTPQDASTVKAGPKIAIHLMADPRA